MSLSRSDAAAYAQNSASPHPLLATPMTGTSRTPRSTRPTSAGNVSSFAKSPVAPKITRASMGSVAIFSSLLGSRWEELERMSVQPLGDVVADAKRVGDRGEGGVHGSDAREEARVDDVEVVDVVRLAVHVEHGAVRIGPEADGAGLVRGRADRHPLVQVDAV